MRKILLSFATAFACCIIAVCAGCGDKKKPEPIKDGEALTMTAGESISIDLSEYISVEGTEYAYEAESSDTSVATVSVEGNTATVAAVAEGSAEITASADTAEVKFEVTVNPKPVQPKPAPVFVDATLTYDLKDKQSGQITLAPVSGEATYSYAYALKEADESVTIEGDKLTAAYTSAIEKTLTVVATYTDSSNSFNGERAVEFKVAVKVTDTREPAGASVPELKESEIIVEKDLFEEDASSFTIDFADNVSNPDNVELRFTVKNVEEDVALNGSQYSFVYGTYDETATTVVYSVSVNYNVDGEDGTLAYTYTLKIKDTRAYRAENGNFDNDLEGWELNGEIGAITDRSTFWAENFPIFNDGKYFSGDGKEEASGKLKSSLFKVGGAKKITYMLGAAGNKDCYITLEKEDGTVLEIWRNTKFEDVGNWQFEEIGKTQFACNLVTYVADLSAYAGETVRIVLNDNADNGFAFFNFDKLVTYYASEDEVPEGVATVNELADKTALREAVEGAITEQGDYTEESFIAYREKVTAAQAVLDKFSAMQSEVDTALTELQTAKDALALREPEEKADAEKEIIIVIGKHKQITLSDYIDDKGLSGITYEAKADGKVTLSEISEGKFTITAGTEEGETQVTVTVKYKEEVKLTVTLTVTVISEKAPELKKTAVERSVDLYSEQNTTDITLDFADNVNDFGVELEYSVTCDGAPVTLDGTSYTLTYGSYTDEDTVIVYTVNISYALSGDEGELVYTYTLKIKDTRAYRAENGNFDNDLEGWELNGEIGAITDKSTFWAENFPIFNDGKYFSGDGKEEASGKLKSSLFKVGGAKKITYMLGAAGNKDCYITLEKEDGTVLEIWRNTKFEDVGNWQFEEIGKTQFACNLVTYVADLSAYAGETVRIVLNDNADEGFAFFNFDKLVTYYATEEEVPEGIATVNEIADKTALKEAVEGAITEQGDYTEQSFIAYREKVTAAQAVLDKSSAMQSEVDTALTGLQTAKDALALREPEEKDAEKTVVIFVGNSKELTISDYIDDKGLSGITYTATADGKVTLSEISEGKFTVTAGSEKGETQITVTLNYKGENKLTVTLTVHIEDETAPTLKEEAFLKDVDLFSAEDKEKIILDFAENVNNIGGLKVSYSATLDNQSLTLDGSLYAFKFDTYSETAVEVIINVKVSYTVNGVNGELEYAYTLNIRDTREFRIVNGTFDNGLEGWTLSNSNLGAVNADETYWSENVPFNADGKFFNAYAFGDSGKDAIESAMGTLTSSAFKIGGSGWITYKLGGAKNADKVYLDVIEKDTGAILARYYNNAFSDDNSQTAVRGCTLIAYKADLSQFIGKTVYIRLVDNGVKDYGLFFADSFVTYYASEEELAQVPNTANPVKHPDNIYQVYNGGFDDGLQGWFVETTDNQGGDFGVLSEVENELWGVNKQPYNNDGNFFKNGHEPSKGYLQSNSFTVSENGWLTFKLGGNSASSYVAILDANTGNELARFVNKNFVGDWGNNKGWEMYAYKVNLIESGISAGTEVRIKVVDNAFENYGVVVVDSFAAHTADPGDNFEKIDKVTTE